uniref:AlkB homolog 3, alpha-ketoglutarate-dependent dioxygenase n=1 Tax=Hippocampus comes TaxID=109280 RepID=A0A3Q2XGC2_HIPCM
MSDKRQRARVQGSWAKQLPKQPRPAVSPSQNATPAVASWGIHRQTTSANFEFHQPIKPVRDVPPEKVIDQAGDYEISHEPSGVSRLRLVPGFLPADEADWIFSKLLAELPWSQKTNVRQGGYKKVNMMTTRSSSERIIFSRSAYISMYKTPS